MKYQNDMKVGTAVIGASHRRKYSNQNKEMMDIVIDRFYFNPSDFKKLCKQSQIESDSAVSEKSERCKQGSVDQSV